MAELQEWEKGSAAVEGYVVPPGESLERPFFPTSRALAWTASTGGLISVEEGVLEPGEPGPMRHYHTNVAECFYVLAGELWLQLGDRVVRAEPGTFAFCPIGCVHAFRAAGDTAARVLIIAMPPGVAEAAFRAMARMPTDASPEAWDELSRKWGMVVVGPPLEDR